MVDRVSAVNAEPKPDLNIVLRGRIYPLTCRRVLPPPDIPSESETPATRLQQSILSQLSFPSRHPDSFRGSCDVVRAFCSDMVLLEAMASQWRQFLRHLRRVSIVTIVGKNVPKKQQQRAVDLVLQVMGHESAVMVDDGGVLNGNLIEQPSLQVFQTLHTTLRAAVSRFVDVMMSDMDQLSDLRVVGLLEWFGKHTCHFHYYQHDLKSLVDVQTTERQQVPMTQSGKTRFATDIIAELSGRHVHSVTRRSELLMEARSRSASDPQLVLPKAVRDCIAHCPVWLRPDLEVVEGEKVREEWVELVCVEHEWQERWCRQRIQPHFDPALILFGQYVLMGWGEREHEAEIRRRVQQGSDELQPPQSSRTAVPPNRRQTQLVAWIVAVVFGMLMLIGSGQDAGRAVAILLPLTSISAIYRYLSGGPTIFQLDRLEPSLFLASLSRVFCVLSGGFVLAGLLLGPSRWQAIVIVGMFAAVLFEIFRRQCPGGKA